MKKLILLTLALLADLCSANPLLSPENHERKWIIEANFFQTRFQIYSSQHDIINLMLPLNALNFNYKMKDDDKHSDNDFHLFFTEVDIGANGEKDYKGLYVLRDGAAHKLLENGRDSTSCNGDNKDVYFAASDGIYHYNYEKTKAEKYGTINDNFISILQENGTDKTILYTINENHDMFKITGEGTKKEKIKDVANAQQFVMDFQNNIYFYNQDKEVYVINGERVIKVKGLKENPSYIQLIKPTFVFKDYVPILIDDQEYFVYANGTTKLGDYEIKDKPTGYALEGTLIQFYAFKKKIYKYNYLEIIMMSLTKNVKAYFDDKVKA